MIWDKEINWLINHQYYGQVIIFQSCLALVITRDIPTNRINQAHNNTSFKCIRCEETEQALVHMHIPRHPVYYFTAQASLSRAKNNLACGLYFWQPCFKYYHTSFFNTISTSVIFLIPLPLTLSLTPVGWLLFEELCLPSNPSSPWGLIKWNWAELSWHWRDRRSSFSQRHWVMTALKDRRIYCGNRVVLRVGLSVCNEELMPSNMEFGGAQTGDRVPPQ